MTPYIEVLPCHGLDARALVERDLLEIPAKRRFSRSLDQHIRHEGGRQPCVLEMAASDGRRDMACVDLRVRALDPVGRIAAVEKAERTVAGPASPPRGPVALGARSDEERRGLDFVPQMQRRRETGFAAIAAEIVS